MFTNDIQEFTRSLDALRDYNNYIEPLVVRNIQQKFETEYREMKCLEVTFDKLAKLSKNATEEEIQAINDAVRMFYTKDIEISYDEEDGWYISAKEEDADRISNAVTNMENLKKQLELMYKSTLINLVSNVECFFGDILHKYFNTYKGEIVGKLIEAKDKIYTIKELEEFGNIEEAKNFIIDKKIENLIRASFRDWIEFLKTKMNLNMGYLNDNLDELEEIFQRRNLFIHNKGVINRIYLVNVNETYRYSNIVGEKIIIERDYLEKAIDLLEKNFILIVFELWKKREKDSEFRGRFMTSLSEKYMRQERWDLLKSITTFIMNDGATMKALVLQAQINFWLAEKRLGKMDCEVIKKTDFSASKLEYSACQAALLDDYEATYALLDRALETQQISSDALFEWPVFMEFRDTEYFSKLVEERKISQPIKNSIIYPQIEMDNEGIEYEDN